jgi:Fe-S-cluster-containing dehydrogenase component
MKGWATGMSHTTKIRLEHPERCIGCYNCVFTCSTELFSVISATKTAISIKPCSPDDRFVVTICTGCENPPCVAACEAKALQKDAEGKLILVRPSECDKCETLNCVKACITGALLIDTQTNRPILCTQCGECADVCPHEVITFKERKI